MEESQASTSDGGQHPPSEEPQQRADGAEEQQVATAALQVDDGPAAETENNAKRRKIDSDNQVVAADVAEKDSSTQPAGASEETKEDSTAAQMPSNLPNAATGANVVQQQQEQAQQPGALFGGNPGLHLQSLLLQSQLPAALAANQFPAQMPGAASTGSGSSGNQAPAAGLPPQLWGPAGLAAASNPLLSQALGLNIHPGSLPSTSAGQAGISGTNPALGTGSAASMQAQLVDKDLTGRPPTQLYMMCDDDSLSEYQCLVRKNIELFEARQDDVESNAQGRNRPIVMGQVGIRCRHCTMLPPKHRSRGAIYYPAKLYGLYQAAQNMASSHLCEHCQHVPATTRAELLKLKDRKSSAGGGKKYWADGVRVLGVFEDEGGLRFEKR